MRLKVVRLRAAAGVWRPLTPPLRLRALPKPVKTQYNTN
jgi:hypothetical protein